MQAKYTCRRIIFILILNLMAYNGISQEAVILDNHYLFPKFVNGTVLMKTGVKNPASLNYNTITAEMIFDNNGSKLALGQLDMVDTVYIDGRRFIPLKNSFVELIYQSRMELFFEHKSKVKDPGKSVGYGGTSQTSSVSSYSSLLSGGQLYELKLPDGFETEHSIAYTLKIDGKYESFLSLRQLFKLFPEKDELIKEYKKDNNLKYENPESIVALIKYLENN
jgi:hypothetical protein